MGKLAQSIRSSARFDASLPAAAVAAVTGIFMQRALEEIRAATGQPMEPEQVRRIAPTHQEGINLRGTFNFPVARYARRILPSLASDQSGPVEK